MHRLRSHEIIKKEYRSQETGLRFLALFLKKGMGNEANCDPGPTGKAGQEMVRLKSKCTSSCRSKR